MIICLDVDGVLIHYRCKGTDAKGRLHEADPSCVSALNKLIKATNSFIVLSSAWREKEEDIEVIKNTFKICCPISSKTPVRKDKHRGLEILEYMVTHHLVDDNGPKFNEIIVIDDGVSDIYGCIPKSRVIYVEDGLFRGGLTDAHVNEFLSRSK